MTPDGGAEPSRRLGRAPHAELLQVLMLSEFDRVDRIGSSWGNPVTRTFAELLIGCEEDRKLRAVLIRMLREAQKIGPKPDMQGLNRQ